MFSLPIHDHLNWNKDTKYMILNLIGVRYAIRSIFHISSTGIFQFIAYFYSVIRHGGVMWTLIHIM